LWIDSPSNPRGNGLLPKEGKVWLDKIIPKDAQGICRVKLEDNELRYVLDISNLATH